MELRKKPHFELLTQKSLQKKQWKKQKASFRVSNSKSKNNKFHIELLT